MKLARENERSAYDKKKISLITGGEGREERNSEKFKALHMGEKRKREKRVS